MTTPALLVDPPHTAVITMECQRGIIGDLATIPALRAAVEQATMIDAAAAVVDAARSAGALVVHAVAQFRTDRLGSPSNAPLLAFAATIDGQLLEGSESTEVVAELGPQPADIVSARRHGVSPFTGTDLDAILRSRSITTVIAVGVSLNVGITGLCIEAVNLGYRVVVPVDATVAVPPEAGAGIIRHTLSQLAIITESAVVVDALGSGAASAR